MVIQMLLSPPHSRQVCVGMSGCGNGCVVSLCFCVYCDYGCVVSRSGWGCASIHVCTQLSHLYSDSRRPSITQRLCFCHHVLLSTYQPSVSVRQAHVRWASILCCQDLLLICLFFYAFSPPLPRTPRPSLVSSYPLTNLP